jgi:lipopolysaccharide/colanic/teichoic acid biosynthesis glycosyltransferase
MGYSFFPKGVSFVKRLFDLAASILALIVLSPFLLLIAILLVISQGWPILYIQRRPGYKGIPFDLLKFRTMRPAHAGEEGTVHDGQRLTGIGQFLRSYSLDELPELWNILLGNMSIVGPRPLLMQYLPLYSPEQIRRHDVLPGLTGWAQIHGRNALSWEDKFIMDVWYVDHRSFWLDMKIILLTIWKVIKREGISQEGEATMREWKGD